MRKTNLRILETALQLFNAHGLSSTPLRTVAGIMGISQGNLNYHYKKRDDIIEALYHRLVQNVDKVISTTQAEEITLRSVFGISKAIMESFYEYRFFFLDFAQIMRSHKKIKAHYVQLVQIRQQQFLGIVDQLQENGIMRPERLPNEYLFLFKRTWLLNDFWITSAQMFNRKITKRIIVEHCEIINQAYYPYLTEKGKAEFFKIMGYRV